jgi:hypothetical protein
MIRAGNAVLLKDWVSLRVLFGKRVFGDAVMGQELFDFHRNPGGAREIIGFAPAAAA